MGMRVIAIDGGDAKRDLCLSLGAEKFIDFTTCSDITSEIMKITSYGAHGVIVFSATKAGYEQAPHLLRPNGTMVCVGLPKDDTIIAGAMPIMMCLKKLNIVGSVVGTLKDVEEVSLLMNLWGFSKRVANEYVGSRFHSKRVSQANLDSWGFGGYRSLLCGHECRKACWKGCHQDCCIVLMGQ
jgi:D-arabinose 1-dehydrogenase-like Zn-dependent alcohol dehydrogenase